MTPPGRRTTGQSEQPSGNEPRRSRWQRFRFWLTHRCLFPYPERVGRRWTCPGCGARYEVEWVEELTAVGNDAMADIGGPEWVLDV